MGADDGRALFGARTHHRPITVGAADAATGSRLGGRAPDVLASTPVRCPRCGRAMEYDLTLAAADLGAGFELSHFHCRDFDCLLRARALTTLAAPPSTLALAHPASRRAAQEAPHDSALEPRALDVGPARSDGDEPPEHSKLGGRPAFLQGEGPEAELSAAGLRFLFQFSEGDYPKGFRVGAYRFGFGSLYVYATFDAPGGPPAGGPAATRFASFWQST